MHNLSMMQYKASATPKLFFWDMKNLCVCMYVRIYTYNLSLMQYNACALPNLFFWALGLRMYVTQVRTMYGCGMFKFCYACT